MNYKNDWQNTGLLAVDLVASCVTFHRRTMKPLKTIYLSPKKFVQFEDYTRACLEQAGRHEEANSYLEKLTFDGVEVKMNSHLMGEQTYFDFYDTPVAQA